jgi:putative transposase
MKQIYCNASMKSICALFGKSRQAFYDIHKHHSTASIEQGLILELVRDVRQILPRIGVVKLHSMITEELLTHHIKIGRDRLFELLRRHELLIPSKRKYVHTTQSWHHYRKWPNLVHKAMAPDQPDQIWVSDITFLRTRNGFIYLSLVTDAFSRKIVGYHLSQYLKASGCVAALGKAITAAGAPLTGLIHHSDRGIQYCCDEYVQLLQLHGIQISMTQSGSPYDNAIAERVNGILKQEFDLDRTFESYREAIEPLANAIYRYNQVRPHFSCGLQTPEQKHYLPYQPMTSPKRTDKHFVNPI